MDGAVIKRLEALKGAKCGTSYSGLEEKWVVDGRVVNITRSPIDWNKATSPMYTERTTLTSNEKKKYGVYRTSSSQKTTKTEKTVADKSSCFWD